MNPSTSHTIKFCHETNICPPINSKTTGQYHSTKGNIVEAIGNVTGLQSWQTSGKEEHAKGEAEYKAAQAKGYAEGVKDRVSGKVDSVVGAVTGDSQQEISGRFLTISYLVLVSLKSNLLGNIRHDKGEAQQKLNE